MEGRSHVAPRDGGGVTQGSVGRQQVQNHMDLGTSPAEQPVVEPLPNQVLHLTAYRVRYAPASGRR